MFWIDISLDAAGEAVDRQREFWAAALGWSVGKPWVSHPEFASLLPPDGDSNVHSQTLANSADQPRVHVDFTVDDVRAETDRLCRLGAEMGGPVGEWQILRSPGGMQFCLVPSDSPKSRPRAVEHVNGVRSRLVQVSIDAPTDVIDAEISFWRAATEWRWQAGDEIDFPGKLLGPPHAPVQLLLQRLQPGSPERETRAHIDLGADMVDKEVARLRTLGALLVYTGEGFVALRDPLGVPFCVTRNSPDI